MIHSESFDDNLNTFCDRLLRYETVKIPFAWLPYVCSRVVKVNRINIMEDKLIILSYNDNQFEVTLYKAYSE
jgi:hypothetical protein